MDSPKKKLNPPFVGNFGSSSRPVLTILVTLMLLRFVFAFLSGCVFPVEGVFVMCRPFSACHSKLARADCNDACGVVVDYYV